MDDCASGADDINLYRQLVIFIRFRMAADTPACASLPCSFQAPSIPVCLISTGTEFAGHSSALLSKHYSKAAIAPMHRRLAKGSVPAAVRRADRAVSLRMNEAGGLQVKPNPTSRESHVPV